MQAHQLICPLCPMFLCNTFRFHKVRVDPHTSLVLRDDYTFADTVGNPVRFGRAGDCYSAASPCKRGKFQIDLTGTGLRVRRDVGWEAWGSPKIPSKLVKYRKSPDGSMVFGECGGSCGGCQPQGEKLYLEPAKCAAEVSMGEFSSWPGYEVGSSKPD